MARLLTHVGALLLGILLGVSAPSQLSSLHKHDQPIAMTEPQIAEPEPTIAPPMDSCELDPANLPPTPSGPDGRPSNYLHTCGNRIYDYLGNEVRITGLNWNGMETGDHVPGGLGSRKWQEILDLVASLGYNTIRLPFSNEVLEPGRTVGGVNFELNPDLKDKSPLEVLDLLIAGARDRGLKVILDRHRPTPYSYPSLWYTWDVDDKRWIEDWRKLTARYLGNDTVIGMDLSNEPRGEVTWGGGDPAVDWRLAAERAGNAILDVNPYLLILVEGIENHDGAHYWWGGNLLGVRDAPVRLKVPGRLVYSPHDYGPSISNQPWFEDPLFPAYLPDVWDRYWGYIHLEGIAPVLVGEFGGRSVGDDRDGQWQKMMLSYLKRNRVGAIVWSLNPNWDTGGIVGPDWRTVEAAKQELYSQILSAPLDSGALGIFGKAPTRLKVLFRQERPELQPSIAFAFKIANDGPDDIDLSRFELRYWLRGEQGADSAGPISIEASKPISGRVAAELVSLPGNNQDCYIRIHFAPDAGYLERYGTSSEVVVRLSTSAWPNHVDAGDFSYATPAPQLESFWEWDRVTLYLDGSPVWGQEP